MKIPCIRCGIEIDTPNASNADYITASDLVVREPRDVLIAIKHNQVTLSKQAKMAETETYLHSDGVHRLLRPKYPNLVIHENEYDAVEVLNISTATKQFGEDLVKVVAKTEVRDIQKTGIICPKCHKSTDFVIWGVHKK